MLQSKFFRMRRRDGAPQMTVQINRWRVGFFDDQTSFRFSFATADMLATR